MDKLDPNLYLDSESESDEDENLDEDPSIEHINISHQGGVNRIRAMPQGSGVVIL